MQTYILNNVIHQINRDIALHSPERGGALLGLIGKPIITHFILDEQAQTSSASYLPSPQLTQRVQQLELQRPDLEFKGVIHSHPGGYDRLSGPDEQAIWEGLKINPHLPFFFAPIVTLVPPGKQLRDHELPLSQGKISFYIAHRDRNYIRIETLPIHSMSEQELTQMQQIPETISTLSTSSSSALVQADLERVRHTFGGSQRPEIFTTQLEGRNLLAANLILKNLDLLLMFSESYPVTPPVLLATVAGENTEQVELPWSLTTAPEERLVMAIGSIIQGKNGPYQKVYGPLGKSGLTADGKIAALAGWSGYFSETDPQQAAQELQQGLFARSMGIITQDISQKRVLIAGTGSVGSYIAEQLVRSGVKKATLIDPEMVETANLCRTSYDLMDIGQPKVNGLARRLLNINSLVQLTLEEKNLLDYEVAELDALVQEADLVIATTDDQAAQRIINRFSYFHGKPALFVGLYKAAEGGEVIITVPEKTPCYLCGTGNRHHFEEEVGKVSSEGDYGSNGRVMGEVALAADIHHVSSVAVKFALSLLLPENAEAKLNGFLNPALESGFNYLTLGMVPNYWFYPQIFQETSGQYAFQSVWLTAKRQTECPVCGEVHHRVDPRSIPLKSVNAANIRSALSQVHS